MKVEPWDRFMWERAVRAADALTGRQVQAGLVLASYADADGSRVAPGMETLADDCRCSPATARRAVQGLLAYGLLEEVRRGGGFATRGGVGLPTEYRLTVPAGEDDWRALEVREPGERRRRRLSAHQRAESAPVDDPTLRSPLCEESGPAEGTHRSPVTDSPLIPGRLSAHPDARGPQDQPRPDHLSPQPAESEPSLEPTRGPARETPAAAVDEATVLAALGHREDRMIVRTAEFKPLWTLSPPAFEGGLLRHLADLVTAGSVPDDWLQGTRSQIDAVRLRVHRALLAETLAARRSAGPSRRRRSA